MKYIKSEVDTLQCHEICMAKQSTVFHETRSLVKPSDCLCSSQPTCSCIVRHSQIIGNIKWCILLRKCYNWYKKQWSK